MNQNVWRFLGAFNGTVFVLVGFWVTISQIHCGLPLPNASGLIGPLQVRPWLPDLGFILFAGFIGVWNAYRMRPILRELTVLLSISFGFAASQSASFHTGVQAERWASLAAISIILGGAVWFAAGVAAKRRAGPRDV